MKIMKPVRALGLSERIDLKASGIVTESHFLFTQCYLVILYGSNTVLLCYNLFSPFRGLFYTKSGGHYQEVIH